MPPRSSARWRRPTRPWWAQGRGESGPGGGRVGDGGLDGVFGVVDVDGRGGAGGVLAYVGQGLLNSAVDGALDGRRRVVGQVRPQLGLDAAGVDQAAEIGQGRLGSQLGGAAARGAQDADHVPQLLQALHAQPPDGGRGLLRLRVPASHLERVVHMQVAGHVADAAAETNLSNRDLVGMRIQLLADAAVALLVLLMAVVLSVYRPRGLTRYGWHKQHEPRAPKRPAARGDQAAGLTVSRGGTRKTTK